MRVEVMQHFGLTVPFSQAGYYETNHHKDLMKDVRGAINEGRLIAICGVIGSGKTVMLRRLQQALEDEKKVTVSKSLAIEKHSIKLATFIAALYYDLSTEKQVRIPDRQSAATRPIQRLPPIPGTRRPGSPLQAPTSSAVGFAAACATWWRAGQWPPQSGLVRPLLGARCRHRAASEYIHADCRRCHPGRIRRYDSQFLPWSVGAGRSEAWDGQRALPTSGRRRPRPVPSGASSRSKYGRSGRGPHRQIALPAACSCGPVHASRVRVSRPGWEPTLTRHGYRIKDLVEQFDAKPAEIKAMFNNSLEPARVAELREKMLYAGLPI